MNIRKFRNTDLEKVLQLFYYMVYNINFKYYNKNS